MRFLQFPRGIWAVLADLGVTQAFTISEHDAQADIAGQLGERGIEVQLLRDRGAGLAQRSNPRPTSPRVFAGARILQPIIHRQLAQPSRRRLPAI